ncbi:RagB/SusD family nutrient uptake outer membrane protein [Persicobacter psychrovividus]|uniref:Membrane protein n=1 Tax=Persicobacter psychrovividus TaxID=387638 RepID=A0ABN6LGE8_9BACT|nr:membrane protein [Persicobacter psychrovividus]
MKRFFRNIVLASILIAGATSCSLTEEPNGFVSESNFFKSPKDAQSALTYAYAILPSIEYYSREYLIATEVPGEALTVKPDAGASQHELDRFDQKSNNPIILDMWRYAYIGINRCNAVITNTPKVPGLTDAERGSIIGQAKFLRALHYFNLVRFFGDVVIRTEQVTSNNQTSAKLSPMKDVYALIEQDLLDAEKSLSPNRNFGKANQEAAQALLSKVYLQLASASATNVPKYDWGINSAEMYKKAADYAKKVVVGDANYSFEYDLAKTWDNAERLEAKEMIFVSASSRDGLQEGEYSKLPLMFMPWADGAKVLQLPNGKEIRGGGFEHFYIEDGFLNSFNPKDKRKSELIVSKVTIPNGNGEGKDKVLTYPGDLNSAFPMKYLDSDQIGEKTTCDTPILRYSDIMLVYAEAVGPTAEGYKMVNMIRSRAGLPDLQAGLSIEDFRKAILKERGFELAFEGQRLFDLRRTHSVESVLKDEYGKNITDGFYYYDIPQIEVDTNNSL